MELSSLARLRRYCGKLTDNSENNNALSVLLLAVSSGIEGYLDRELELKERTEYFNSEEGQRLFYTKAYPVVSVGSIYSTVTGKYLGEETEETDFFIDYSERGIIIRRNIGRYYRSMKITYTAGLAGDPVRSVFTIGTIGTAPFEVNQYVVGSRSRAVARVIDNSPNTNIEVETIYGKFRTGDVLSAYQKEDLTGTAIINTAGIITAIISQSLVEAHPAVAMACEFEVNYLYRNSTNSSLWVQNTMKEGTQKRLSNDAYNLQPETQLLLRPYERVML